LESAFNALGSTAAVGALVADTASGTVIGNRSRTAVRPVAVKKPLMLMAILRKYENTGTEVASCNRQNVS
jgi:hypothetical protein